jgi:hypothetical protein
MKAERMKAERMKAERMKAEQATVRPCLPRADHPPRMIFRAGRLVTG